jgi:hypothetical protein
MRTLIATALVYHLHLAAVMPVPTMAVNRGYTKRAMRITIDVPLDGDNYGAVADCVHLVAEQIEAGYAGGFVDSDTHWFLTASDQARAGGKARHPKGRSGLRTAP